MTASLKPVVRAAGGLAASVVLASVGMPGLAAVVFVALLLAGLAYAVISDEERSARVVRMIFALRGDFRCLERDPLRAAHAANGRAVSSASGSRKVPVQRT